jgi:ketohexokinase
VINHNPIPDITHDEFFRILGPLLYSTLPNGSETPKYGQSPPGPPIDWLHFEGRSPHITSENLQGLDSWLRERDWRQRVVLSVELTKVGTQEIEGVSIPVVLLSLRI